MTAPLLPNPIFLDTRAPSGQVFTYIANTTTPQVTYSDAAGTVPNTNPVILDTTGAAIIRLGAGLAYDFVIKDQTGTVTIDTINNYVQSIAATAAAIGAILYPVLGAESGVTAAVYPYGNVLRHGADPTGSVSSSSAFNNAITSAVALNVSVAVPGGTYLLASTITAPQGLNIIGVNNQFTYGTTPQSVILKYTGSAATFIDTAGNPYVTLKNLTLNGNGVATKGFSGGFISELDNVSILNCNGSGLFIIASPVTGQRSKYSNCAFNGNTGDGVKSAGGLITTQYFDTCVMRQNSGYGVNGDFPSSNFHDCIYESNTLSGANLTGECNDLTFSGTCYFEANDAANGASGYNLRVATDVANEPISFVGTKFGSTGLTQIANVSTGRVNFDFCQQTGSNTATQMTVGATAEVFIRKSFINVPMPANVKIFQEVAARADHAVLLSSVSDFIVTNSPSIVLGTADFTVSSVFEANTASASVRCLCSGNTGAFEIELSGSSGGGMTAINFFKSGGSSFHTSTALFPFNAPMHLVYVRASSVATVYLNGVQIDTFADANNYTVTQGQIGSDGNVTGFNGKIYSFTYMTAALTAQKVFDLWRCGGDAVAAASGSTVFDMRTDIRPVGWVYDLSATKWLAFQGSAAWVSPNPAAVTASTIGAAGGASALPATPLGYKIDFVAGAQVKTPYYNP